jgi:hypothetical protein
MNRDYSDQEFQMVYYVVLDSDFGTDIGSYNFGKINKFLKDHSDKIPVLLNFDDAKNLAERMAVTAVRYGTTTGKKHPIFGSIIIGYKIHKQIKSDLTIDLDAPNQYNSINLEDSFSVFNTIKIDARSEEKDIIQKQKAIVSKELLNSVGPHSYTYIVPLKMEENVGFYLFNKTVPSVSESDISLLKYLIKQPEKEITIEHIKKDRELFRENYNNVLLKFGNVSKDIYYGGNIINSNKNNIKKISNLSIIESTMKGGSKLTDADYAELAKEEKAKYLKLKQKLNSNVMSGGGNKLTDADYAELAREEKAKYLKLKQKLNSNVMSGGGNKLTDADYAELAREEKARYLKLKQKLNIK